MAQIVKERIGSSKKVTATGAPGEVLITDLGTTSVFDIGPIPNFTSPELAIHRVTQTVRIFGYLEKLGIPTHFIRREDPYTIRVHECAIGSGPSLSGSTTGRHSDLELLFRIAASDKFDQRWLRGEIAADRIRLPDGMRMAPGVKFLIPFVEASTKWEKIDRYLSEEEAAEISNRSLSGIQNLYQMVAQTGQALDTLFASIGFDLIDGKFETTDDCLIDGISLDELGVTNHGAHFGKNLLRNYYKKECTDWYAKLVEAQEKYPDDKSAWPEQPELPEDLKQLHITRYKIFAEKLTEVLICQT